jgi:hypothetical protein
VFTSSAAAQVDSSSAVYLIESGLAYGLGLMASVGKGQLGLLSQATIGGAVARLRR